MRRYEEIKSAFQFFDKGCGGRVHIDEMVTILEAVSPIDIERGTICKILEEIDDNGDGTASRRLQVCT